MSIDNGKETTKSLYELQIIISGKFIGTEIEIEIEKIVRDTKKKFPNTEIKYIKQQKIQ